jgi:hypothetical protein
MTEGVSRYAIADQQGWLVGETLERALAALQREMEDTAQPDRLMSTCRSVVMSALPSRAMPDDLARLYVLEATIGILKTENEILKRRLAAAETWAAQTVITKRPAKRRPWRRLARPAFRIVAAAIATTLIWPGR